MQLKHVIIFALAGFVILIGFNMMSGGRYKENKVAVVDTDTAAPAQTDSATASNSSANIASKPLGEQPKAILEDATNKIDQAQQADRERLEKMSSTQ